MERFDATTKCALALALAGLLAIGPALAEKGGKSDKGERAEKGDHQKGQQRAEKGHQGVEHKGVEQKGERGHSGNKAARDHGGPTVARRAHFEDRHGAILSNYYGEQHRAGRCPPGLAKKHNGCMPPGQAKKWNMGQPLPQGVVYYSVPQSLVVQFGPPPSGYRYVRVSSDILLMAIGTRMIVDAIQGRS